jgi:hypothetical protein
VVWANAVAAVAAKRAAAVVRSVDFFMWEGRGLRVGMLDGFRDVTAASWAHWDYVLVTG